MAAHGQLRTGAIMVASLLLALALYYGYLGSALVQPVAEWTAQWSGRGLGLLGTSTSVDGTVLWSDGLAFEIVAECTPVGPLALLVGAMLAYPAPWRSRLLGALIGGHLPYHGQPAEDNEPFLGRIILPRIPGGGAPAGVADGHRPVRGNCVAALGAEDRP